MENLLVFFLILFLVNPVSGGATFLIKVIEFYNPNNLNIFGDCCDGVMIDETCFTPCSYTIKICFSPDHCSFKKNMRLTGEGKNYSTGVITESFPIWEPITMNISVYDEDTQSSELIDEFHLNFKHLPVSNKKGKNQDWARRELTGSRKKKPTRLLIEMLPMCEENFFQEDCSTKCVAQNECSGHYTCGQMGQKICYDDWSGENCEKPAVESKRCSLNEICDNGGTCAKQGNAFYCCCPNKYEGRQCEKLKSCKEISCKNGGFCSPDGKCICPAAFSGPFCEIQVTTTYIRDIMTTESSSHPTITQSQQCPKNYYGRNCNVFCQPQDDCIHGSYKCNEKGKRVCQAGWISPLCEVPKIKCIENECRNNGSCIDGKCCCPSSFNGILCQDEIIQCESNPCKNGGICEDQIGSFKCLCKDGFAGIRCELTIKDFSTTQSLRIYPEITKTMIKDISTTNSSHVMTSSWETISCPPNRHGDSCNDNCKVDDNTSVGHWMCDSKGQKRCKPGWTGPLCDIRTNAIILCSSEPNIYCRHGECVNKSCSCYKGYKGLYCQREILECISEPCKNGGHCVDGIGNFSCTCKPGFTGTTCNRRITEHTSMTMPYNTKTITTENVTNETVHGTRDSITISSKSTNQVSTNTVISNVPNTTQFSQVSSTVELRDVLPTTQEVTELNVSTSTTTEGLPQSTSLKTPGDGFLTRTLTPATTKESIKSTSITKSLTKTSLIFTSIGSKPMTKRDKATSIIPSPPAIGNNKSIPLSSPTPTSANANITVTSINMSTVTKKIPMSTTRTKSTNSEYVTNGVSEAVTTKTAHKNETTRMVSTGTTQIWQYERTNFTIFLHLWVPDSKEIIRNVIKLAWNEQKSINNSSKMNFHVKTQAVFLCLTRNGEKVTELIFSVSYIGSHLIQTKAPTVETITVILKNLGYFYEVYTGLRPWRYEYHYALFFKERELPWSVHLNDTLMIAWLKKYTEFREYFFEIAIVLSERYLLPNGLDVTKFTYFVLSNYRLVDPKKYPAPSLSGKLSILSPSQKKTILRYKDLNSVCITKTINNNDYEQLEKILKKSLTETFKELNKSCDLQIKILKKEKFITLDRNMVWKVIFRIFNSTSKISFPQNKLNDIWFDHIDNHLNRTKPFKMRGNRVYRNNTAIDSFYTYAIVLNGFVPYKVCNTLELHLVKVWRNSSLRAQGNFSVRILQISPYIGDYGSEAAMVIYVVYNEDKLLNPRIEFSPSTDQLNDYFNQGPFYGIYRRNIIQLISNEFLYSFTLNYVLTGKDHFQLRVPLARVWSQLIFNGVGNDSNPMQIYFASPKLVVTTNNLIVSKIRYFTLNNSTPLNPTLVDGPGMKLLQSEGIDVYDKPIRPLMKLEVKKPYVNLRQLRQIQSALVSVWTPKGSANVKIFTKTKEQLINNTGHIHTRLRYFINLEVPLANPDFSLIPDYLDFDANRRLYRLNILNAYKRVEKFDLIIVGLRKAWAAANKDVRLSELHPIIHSWDSNYHMVTWGLVTQIFYTLTIDGIESSLTALSEPALEDYKPALEKEANISLCNCTALRGHSFYLLGSLTSPSLLGQIENVIAIAWKNFNLDFAGNLTAHLRTVDDSFESENKDVSEITYIIVPILDEVIIPDEELEPVTQAILIKTFENYLPTMKILTNIPYKRKDLIFWPIIAVCIIIGSILIMLLLLFVLYGHRKKMEENLITDPKLLKGYNREHFASEPESPREFKNTASLYKDSFKPKRHYSRYGNQIISGSYDINTNSAADMNNLEINSSKLSDKEKHAVKLLPPKDNHSTNIQRENVHTKEEKIDQFITENKAKELKVKEIARSNETDNIVVGCVPGTDVSKLSDSSDSKVAVDNDTSGVDFKKGSKKEMKQKSIKSTAKHVTINLDTPNDIESRDSNMKNEKEKESFPIEIDSKTAYKTDIQLLESSTEKAETHKVNETANQNNVNFENKSSFIDSVNSEQESIETLTTVSSKKVLTFKSEEVDVGDTKAENLDNVLNKDIKIEDNILNGSILNTDDTKRSDESKIQIEGDKKELADETSMVNTFVDIDFKAPNETKTSAETSSRDEDITLNSTTSGEDNQILQGNKSSAVKMSVGLDEKDVNPMITNGIFSDGSIVINDEKNINFENKSSVFHNSSITCLTRELQQPKVNQEIKHTVTVPTNKENELLSKNKLSLENSANLRYSVADNIKTFEEFFSTHKMDKLHYKETTNENKSSQSECLATDDKNQVDQLEELTRESLVDPKANSTTSTEDPVSVRSQVKNGTLEKDEASFIPMSLTTFNGYNKDSDKDVNSNQAFVTIIQVGESNTKTHAK